MISHPPEAKAAIIPASTNRKRGDFVAIRGWFQFKKMRLLLAWAAIPILILSSNMNDRTFRWGIITMILGELIRFWALGFIEKKGEKLAMSGPYAFVRNPLYVGNFFLGLGITILVWNWMITVLFLVGFLGIYTGTIRGEEKYLRERHGKTFEDYCAHVRAFFPRLTPYKAPQQDSFRWDRIIKHHEYVTVLGIMLIAMLIHLYDEIILAKESVGDQLPLLLVTLAVILVLALERLFISRLHVNFFKRLFEKHHDTKKS